MWIGLYSGTGLGRVDAEDGTVTAMNRLNSGLRGQHVINVRVHPDGPVITMHDQTDTLKVEILVDPANWSSAGSWLAVPNARLGAVESTDINDTVVQRRDVIWFAVSDVGLVRWDINGASAETTSSPPEIMR